VRVSAAIAAGVANWLRPRRDPVLAAARASRAVTENGEPPGQPSRTEDDGHQIYLNPWAGEEDAEPREPPPVGPSVLP
jgi:hypothetical protein